MNEKYRIFKKKCRHAKKTSYLHFSNKNVNINLHVTNKKDVCSTGRIQFNLECIRLSNSVLFAISNESKN